MSKKTHWKLLASNIQDFRTPEEKRKYQKKQFAWGLALHRMKIQKPHWSEDYNDKPFYENKKKKQKKSA